MEAAAPNFGVAMELSQGRDRLIRRLYRRKTREREGLVLIEGVRSVLEALFAQMRVRFAVVSPRLDDLDVGGRLSDLLVEEGIEVVGVTDAVLSQLSDTERHQGVLLVAEAPVPPIAEVTRGPRCLLLDGVQDPGNLGTLIRAASAFGISGVVALDGSVDVWNPKAVRASAGGHFKVPVVSASWSEVAPHLEEAGVPVLVADAGGESVRGWRERSRFALVVGNEGAGVRPAVRAAASGVVAVPMGGTTESLNVGMAGAILLFELTQEDRA